MQNKSFFKFAIIFMVAFVLGAGLSYYVTPRQVPLVTQTQDVDSVSVMFDYGNGKIDVVPLSLPGPNATLFETLKKASDDKKIYLGYKDYGGSLGVFIESINEINGSGDAYWQYWVNNTYAQVGASSYRVTPGDIIMFKLAKSQLQ